MMIEQRAMSTCDKHEELVEDLQTLITDLKWLVRIGKWVGGGVCAILLAMIPFVISFFVYMSGINSRVSLVDSQLSVLLKSQTELAQTLVKHTELGSHAGSAKETAINREKINSLCNSVSDIQKKILDLEKEKGR